MRLPRGIYHRKDGRYMWRFQYQKKKYQGYALRLSDAERAMTLRKAEVYKSIAAAMTEMSSPDPGEADPKAKASALSGEARKDQGITFDGAFDRWLTERKIRCKEITRFTYRENYRNHLQLLLGDQKIGEISSEEVTGLLQKISEDYSRTIVNTNIVILNGVFDYAVKQHWMGENVMNRVVLPLTEPGEKRPVLSDKEEAALIEAVKMSRFAVLYLLAILTGMRIGEVCGLCFHDLDWKNRLIHIRHTLDYTSEKGLYLETPKTKSSRRDIPMLKRTEELLRQQMAERERLRTIAGEQWSPGPGMEDLVFTDPHRRPIYQGSINYELSKIRRSLKEKGLIEEHFTFHTLRHCFATRCIEDGMNFKTLQTILGHSSMKTTMDVYTHCLPSTMIRELEAVQNKTITSLQKYQKESNTEITDRRKKTSCW